MISERDFFVAEPAEDDLLNDIIDDDRPLYLEIGSGKGEFISRYPVLHPEWNFIGMEKSEKQIRNCLKKLSKEANPNVRLVRRFADATINSWFKKESLSGVFIQHPDPWPKRRHHRRRLIQQDFLNALSEILIPGAQVQLSTDHEEYANWILEEFLDNPYYVSLQDEPVQMCPNLDKHIVTWFEEAQKRMGYHPLFMLYKRI